MISSPVSPLKFPFPFHHHCVQIIKPNDTNISLFNHHIRNTELHSTHCAVTILTFVYMNLALKNLNIIIQSETVVNSTKSKFNSLFLLYTACHHLILLLPPWILPGLLFSIPTTSGFITSVLLDMFREFVHDLQTSGTSGKHISVWYILFVFAEIGMQNVLLHYFLSWVICH